MHACRKDTGIACDMRRSYRPFRTQPPVGNVRFTATIGAMQLRTRWTVNRRRLGIVSAIGMVLIGSLYIAIIILWIMVEHTPREPIADPYLASMEVLTIVSAVALMGATIAVRCFAPMGRQGLASATFAISSIAAVVTTAIHVRQLTIVRQAWRAGLIADYRLVWPSRVLSVEYFVWDILVGLTLICTSVTLWTDEVSSRVKWSTLVAGALCILGAIGPLSNHMLLQN